MCIFFKSSTQRFFLDAETLINYGGNIRERSKTQLFGRAPVRLTLNSNCEI